MDILLLLSSLILLSCFILIANKRIKAYIRTFQVQSLLIALAALYLGVQNWSRGEGFSELVVCLLVVLLKVFFIPWQLRKIANRIEYKVEKDFFYNIPLLTMASGGIVVLVYFALNTIDGLNTWPQNIYLVNSLSVILIGFFFMIARKRAIGQIVGFLVIENGLFVTAMFSTQGMPLVVELGISIDLLTAVLILGIMVFKLDEHFETTDVDHLKNLKG
jgi:hydrogenase-4 component E